jgi:hypothetical protein
MANTTVAVAQDSSLKAGDITVIGFNDAGKFVFKLEKANLLTNVELVSGDTKIQAKSFSNVDDSASFTAEGLVFNPGRIECTVDVPADFKPDKVIITGKEDSTPLEIDIKSK